MTRYPVYRPGRPAAMNVEGLGGPLSGIWDSFTGAVGDVAGGISSGFQDVTSSIDWEGLAGGTVQQIGQIGARELIREILGEDAADPSDLVPSEGLSREQVARLLEQKEQEGEQGLSAAQVRQIVQESRGPDYTPMIIGGVAILAVFLAMQK